MHSAHKFFSVISLFFTLILLNSVPAFAAPGDLDASFGTGGNSFYGFPFGTNGDMAIPGDYDGDGKIDAAVFRDSNSGWYLQRSSGGITSLQFGTTGDKPIPNSFVR